MRATRLAYIILLDLIIIIIFDVKYKLSSFSLSSFFYYPVISSLLGLNIIINNLFSETLKLSSETIFDVYYCLFDAR
jgi:hypothetical protein